MDDDEKLLELVPTLNVNDPLLSCSSFNSDYEIIAFVRNGDLFLYALPFGKHKPIIRWVPWIDSAEKRLAAICFNPVEGEAILAVCSDRSVYVIPTLVLLNTGNDETFDENCVDILSLPSPIVGETEGSPVAVAWWVRSFIEESIKHTAFVGFTHGLIVAFAIHTGTILFKTSIEGSVSKIEVCVRPGSPFILVTNDSGMQWKIYLNEEGATPVRDIDDRMSVCKKEEKVKETIPCKKDFMLNVSIQQQGNKAYFSISNDREIGFKEGNHVTMEIKTRRDLHSAFQYVSSEFRDFALPHRCSLLVHTNSLLVFANEKLTSITVISQRRNFVNGSNGESIIEEFNFNEGERIRKLFCTHLVREQCSIVTNQGIYCLRLKKSPHDLVLHDLLSSRNYHLARMHCFIFGLSHDKLFCEAGYILLRENSVEEAKVLYAPTSDGHRHYAGALAVLGRLDELMLALRSKDVAKMKILVFTYQYLTNFSSRLKNEFREYLKKEKYIVSIALETLAQAGLCGELSIVMKVKGVHELALLEVWNTIQYKHTIDVRNCGEFWEFLSDESLGETLLKNHEMINFHAPLVQKNRNLFSKSLLLRFERLYSPFARTIRNYTLRNLSTDYPVNLWMETYLAICIQLSSISKEFSGGTVGLFGDIGSRVVKPKRPYVLQNISASKTHAFAVLRGCAYGWGQSVCLGVGFEYNQPPTVVDTLVGLKKRVLGICSGSYHTIALTNDGVYSWGSNTYGQLGIRGMMHSYYPMVVPSLLDCNIVHICAGQYHCLALDDENRVFSWGWGVHGQLGHGDVETVFEPKIIASLIGKGITAMAAGHMHSIFLDASGRVWACGSNSFGQLGIGEKMKKSSLPVQLFGFAESVALISAGNFQNCAVSTDGKLYQWGKSPGMLKNENNLAKRRSKYERFSRKRVFGNSDHFIPKLVRTIAVNGKIIKVAIGCEHSIILTDIGSLYSWGRNHCGQLGFPVTCTGRLPLNLTEPYAIKLEYKIVDVACSWDFSIAMDDCENVWTWGAKIRDQEYKSTLSSVEGEIATVNNGNRVTNHPLKDDHLANMLSFPSLEVEQEMYHPVELPLVLKNCNWRLRMHFALEKCVSHYNPSALLQQSLSISEHDASSKLALIINDLSTATVEKLNSAETENDRETVLRYFLPKLINTSQLNNVLKTIVKYWLERDFPMACFEKVCSCYLVELTKPLGALIFGVTSEVDGISTTLSTDFKLRLVKNMFQFDKEIVKCVVKDFTDFDTAMSAFDAPGDFIDISSDQVSKLCSELKQKVFVRLN